jgi:hypothetical protein
MRAEMSKRLPTLLIAGIFAVAAVTGTPGASKHHDRQNSSVLESQGFTYSLTRLPENPRQYSLVLSDDDEHVVSGSFSVEQLQVLRAIMTEAEKFALSGEAVGSKDPVTTRFTDKQESAFIVDVEKLGNLSTLFLTLKTEGGRMTAQAGKIIRSNGREEGFFFDLLSRLDSFLPKLPAQSPK